MNSMRWRLIFVAILTVWAAYGVSPSIIYFSLPKEVRNSGEELAKRIPDYLPKNHVKLGLDLQGGVQLVLGVNTDNAVDNKLGRIGTEAQRWAGDSKIGLEKAYVLKGKQRLRLELNGEQDVGDFKSKLKEEYPGLEQVERDGQVLDYAYNEDQIRRIKQSAIEQAERVIRNRVDKWGVAEPLINRRRADNSVLVQLPGFKDPGKAKELLGRTAQLKFKLVDDESKLIDETTAELPKEITKGTNGAQPALISENREVLDKFILDNIKIPADREVLYEREAIAGGNKARFTTYVVEASTEVTGDDVLDAYTTQESDGIDPMPKVALRFTGPGGKRFADVTGDNVGRRLAIILDDMVISAPNINEKIPSGQATISLGSGGYNEIIEEANELSLILKSGALPADIEVLEERQVGASLGPELADQGIKGTIFGVLLVFLFMLFYYRKPGVIACGALALNGLFLLALMAGFGFALTLPGIAGFILTLGMAVDANVLINERIRQELREGKNAKKAVENGFKKVFWTIVDANVTTLIAALVLLETNSSGPIRGFAVTLMIGLLVSMFTSLYCSKLFFERALKGATTDNQVRTWLGGNKAVKSKEYHFNFLSKGKLAAIIGIVLSLGILVTATGRGVNWGVDFAGGTEILMAFAEDTEASEIKKAGGSVGIKSMTMQALEGGKKQYLVRFGEQSTSGSESERSSIESRRVQQFKDAIAEELAAKKPEILQTDFVGPQIGRELRSQGIQSVFWAVLGVLLYIGLRFDMRFGPGAVVKMIQDVIIMLGFYVFFWRSFDLTSVAAFLTVVGYSVNDTIVIYDRIRENLTLHAKRSLFDNINFSLNETLSRTINTSVTTVIALIGILVFGSGQIWNFAAAMTLGVIAATLSSQFLASSFVLWLEKWKRNKARSGGSPKKAAAFGSR
jgi:protein-export membrane protein SecD/preprotein translocase SecF subunit